MSGRIDLLIKDVNNELTDLHNRYNIVDSDIQTIFNLLDIIYDINSQQIAQIEDQEQEIVEGINKIYKMESIIDNIATKFYNELMAIKDSV